MIIPQENIETFVSKNDGQYSTYKLHVPSNVFFERVKQEVNNDFVGFRVARFDAATNTVVDEQKFNGTRDTSFFKAVDYFEELVEKNSPKEEQGKQDDFDSVGYFVYFRGVKEGATQIPIEKVVLMDAEARYPDPTPIEFKDFLEASKYIADNLKLTVGGGYDKHHIIATWTDGDTWDEIFDISDKENNPKEFKNIFATQFLRSGLFRIGLGSKGGSTFSTPEETLETGKSILNEIKKYDFQLQLSDVAKLRESLVKEFSKGGWIAIDYKIEPYTKEEFNDLIDSYLLENAFLDPYIDINNEIVTIPYQDVDKVFTPPQTKKFGRLDMTVLDDPKYDVVRSKFALKYTEEKSKEIAQQKGLDVKDVWVYEMQPYSNGTPEEEGDGGTPPPDVNDQPLNANDIEGEEPEQREPKEGEKGEKGEKGEDGENGENGEDEDLGWDEDNKDEPKNREENPVDGGNPNPFGDNEDSDPVDGGNPNPFGDNEDTGNPPPPNNGGTPTGEGEPTDEEGTPVAVYNMDLIEALNTAFKTDDILSAYKTKKTFMSALRLKGEQIRQFAPFVGLDTSATKGEILTSIEEQLTPFYQ